MSKYAVTYENERVELTLFFAGREYQLHWIPTDYGSTALDLGFREQVAQTTPDVPVELGEVLEELSIVGQDEDTIRNGLRVLEEWE